MSNALFTQRALIAGAVVAAGLAAWTLSDVLLLAFGAILIGVVITSLADPIASRTGLPHGVALLASVLLLLAIPTGIALLLGETLLQQLGFLERTLPQLVSGLLARIDIQAVSDNVDSSTVGGLVTRVLSWGAAIAGAIVSLFIVIVAGIYLAADPGTYRQGFVRLFAGPLQQRVEDTLHASRASLVGWLRAQLLAMVAVGAATGFGMWLVGVPSPLALGLIAGLTEFVPYVGPIAGAAPALLIASGQDMQTLLGALAVVIMVQQLENYLILPLAVGRATSLPPALAIFSVLALGVLLGPLGLLFGYPITLVVLTAVRKLYLTPGP